MIHLLAKTPADLTHVAIQLLPLLEETQIVAFYGQMGVGKTTLIKEICKIMGVMDTVNSPSFAIINEYLDKSHNAIYHFDLYRLKSQSELFDLGAEDYFYSGNICLIEWPEKAGSLLPERRINVSMKELHDGSRNITIAKSFTIS